VAVARVVYWAQATAKNDLTTTRTRAASSTSSLHQQDDNDEQVRQSYLQARLGAKAVLTGKVGGGATGRVYTLGTLQISGCLNDMQLYYYASIKNKTSNNSNNKSTLFDDYKRDWIESIAAIVEFDGLETLYDPSPRSELTLQQYQPEKAAFVKRLLLDASYRLDVN
jgi:hypothetical protein